MWTTWWGLETWKLGKINTILRRTGRPDIALFFLEWIKDTDKKLARPNRLWTACSEPFWGFWFPTPGWGPGLPAWHTARLGRSSPTSYTFPHCSKPYAQEPWARVCSPMHTACCSMPHSFTLLSVPHFLVPVLPLTPKIPRGLSTRESLLHLQAPGVGLTVPSLHSQNRLFRWSLTSHHRVPWCCGVLCLLHHYSLSSFRWVQPCIFVSLTLSIVPGTYYSPNHYWLNWPISWMPQIILLIVPQITGLFQMWPS